MTKTELIADIKAKIKSIEQIMDEGDFGCVDQDNWERWAKRLAWHEDILEALCPQPDSATGLMPCGCGGKPEVENIQYDGDNWRVTCKECQTTAFETVRESDRYWGGEESAKENWNRAMGYPDA